MSQLQNDALVIAGKSYNSRLLVGTGKYKDLEETGRAIEASGAEIVTVAVRRTNIGQNPDEPNLLDVVSLRTNTPSCRTPQAVLTPVDAVRTCKPGPGTDGRPRPGEAGSTG